MLNATSQGASTGGCVRCSRPSWEEILEGRSEMNAQWLHEVNTATTMLKRV